jgi:hypothetical protein
MKLVDPNASSKCDVDRVQMQLRVHKYVETYQRATRRQPVLFGGGFIDLCNIQIQKPERANCLLFARGSHLAVR